MLMPFQTTRPLPMVLLNMNLTRLPRFHHKRSRQRPLNHHWLIIQTRHLQYLTKLIGIYRNGCATLVTKARFMPKNLERHGS